MKKVSEYYVSYLISFNQQKGPAQQILSLLADYNEERYALKLIEFLKEEYNEAKKTPDETPEETPEETGGKQNKETKTSQKGRGEKTQLVGNCYHI